ncbi:MAG: MSCRAMM family adhesin SdrC [Epsilonproteobacteria bacterium]|nr:MSCRAMM family adhesin SdrC [Campylobacterota bacterium]
MNSILQVSLFIVAFFLIGCGQDRAASERLSITEINDSKAVGGVVLIDDDGGKDTDGDGLSDAYELEHDLNMTNIDTDGDGLDDKYEMEHSEVNATNPDTDGDTLSDGDEVNLYGTRPDSPDSDDDGLGDAYEVSHDEVDATNPDTDGDGLTDGDEVNTYLTLPNNSDSDDDNLTDGDEVNTYLTLPNNPDSDSDGLSDYQELFVYGTNPLLSDSDGDCLLDGFEILNYETNATNSDTDGDTVEDGLEVYSYDTSELNTTCIDSPETLEGGHNPSPAIDGIPDIAHDVINALDPSNDSDGDGQSNVYENNCTEGDPKDSTKLCPYVFDTEEGNILTEHGYSYIPGGFDVDGDGVNEGGFWMSRYQARNTGVIISSEEVIARVDNVNKYVSKNFKVLNRNIQVTSYKEQSLSETTALAGNELIFDEESVAGLKRISNFTPYLALVCLEQYHLKDKNGTDVEIDVTMPTLKQYMHVKQLLDADMENNGDGRHIRNGLLGTDKNVPLFEYSLIIDEFGEERKEYVRNLVQLRDTFGNKTFDITTVPAWWEIDETKFKFFNEGANSTQDLGHGIGPDKDPYAVIVRGGEVLDITEGISGALTDDEGQTNGISFRAATPYLY